MEAHSARARLPVRSGAVLAQSGEFLPSLRAVVRDEQRGIFNSGVNLVRIGQRWFEMPHSFEFPGVRRSVVPLMRAGNSFIHELVPPSPTSCRRHSSAA